MVIGLLAVVVRVYVSPVANSVTSVVFDAALALVTGWAAVHAKRGLSRPVLRASVVGVIYGGIGGLGIVIVPPLDATVRAEVLAADPTVTQSLLSQVVHYASSPLMHVVQACVAIIFAWLLSLFFAWIVSAFVEIPAQRSV